MYENNLVFYGTSAAESIRPILFLFSEMPLRRERSANDPFRINKEVCIDLGADAPSGH